MIGDLCLLFCYITSWHRLVLLFVHLFGLEFIPTVVVYRVLDLDRVQTG